MNPALRVLLAGGGSAGHVSPLLALADCLTARNRDSVVSVLGTDQGLEARLVPERGYQLYLVPKTPMPRRPGVGMLRFGPQFRAAIRAAEQAISQTKAEVVVGFGGYVCPPAYLAARKLGIPIVIHEQNPLPGLANRLGARMTPYVATSFPDTPLPHATHTGLPLRTEIHELVNLSTSARAKKQLAARLSFGLDPARTTLLVTGGSLGSQRLNQTFESCAAELRAAKVQVLHITGAGKSINIPPTKTGEAPYVVIPYADQMSMAYAAADLVVARSGASTVCEVSAIGRPAVYVPLPIGNGEQRLNAEPIVKAGGALLIEDAGCTKEFVLTTVLPLLQNRAELLAMGQKATAFVVPDATNKLADLVQQAISQGAR